jgi:uncharacterized protein (DUF3084 family)
MKEKLSEDLKKFEAEIENINKRLNELDEQRRKLDEQRQAIITHGRRIEGVVAYIKSTMAETPALPENKPAEESAAK